MALGSSDQKLTKKEKFTGLYFQDKEIILGRRRGRPPKRVYNPENRWWSQEKKIEACTLYAATGSVEQVSYLTDVPQGTVRAWKNEDWWVDVTNQIVKENDESITAKFTTLLEKTLDRMADVVENGNNLYVPKTGETVRVPLNAIDLVRIAGTFTDKRQLLQGKPTARTERVSADDRLKMLAEKFKKFANAQEVTQEQAEEIINEVG